MAQQKDVTIRLGTVATDPWLGWTIPAVPPGATVITTTNQLTTILQGGGTNNTVYDATALTGTFSNRYIINGRYPTPGITVYLGPGLFWNGASVLDTEPAVDVIGATNIQLYGGDITNPTHGYGLIVRGGSVSPNNLICDGFRWWGFFIHNVAQTGIHVHQNNGTVQNFDLRGDITLWSRAIPNGNLALDPHNSKGTGLHGAYIATTPTTTAQQNACKVLGGTCVLHTYSSAWGNGVQLGPDLSNTVVQVKAEDLTADLGLMYSTYGTPHDGTAGNAIDPFGSGQKNLVISYVNANNVRRAVENSGLSNPAAFGDISFTYGRATNIRFDTATGTTLSAYDTSLANVSYTNCI